MKLRLSLKGRPILTILAIAMLGVGLACAGEKATPTSPPTATTAPTATATTAPTATLVPTATATLVPGVPTPTATAVPTATATATLVPTATATLVPGAPTPTATAVPTATATAVPTPTVDITTLPWAERLMLSPGYKPEWGTPQTGGIIKIRSPRTSMDFTPSAGVTTTQGLSNSAYYNTLVRYDPWVGRASITGDLAKSWEMSGDGLQITFKLEEGVKFQNNPNIPERLRNADLTCEDVAVSTERTVRPPAVDAKNIARALTLLDHFTSVSCPDGPLGYVAVMHFEEALGKTMAALASGHFVILDKEYIDWLNTELPGKMRATTPENFLRQTGSGPFVPLSFQPDLMAKVRRNPTYFKEGLPLADGYDWLVLKDYTTAFTALATGNIHIFERGSWALQQGQVAQAERDFKDRIVMYPAAHLNGNGISFDMSKAPLDDRRVRKAMSLAVNRDDYLLFRKAGAYQLSVLTGDLVPGTYFSFTEEELRTWPGIRQPKDQDIAEANRLLDEVFGKGKRFSLPCQGTNTQDQLDVCLFFKDQMKKSLNVDVTLDMVEQAVSTQRGEACQTTTSIGSVGSTRIGDPDDWILKVFHREFLQTPSAICRANAWAAAEPELTLELEALGKVQSVVLDPVKRREIVQQWERKHFDDMITQFLFGWNITVPGTTTAVKGYYTYPFYVDSGMSLYERLWLAK